MHNIRLHKIWILVCSVTLFLVLAACGQPKIEEPVQEQGSFVKIAPGAYDSVDMAIVVAKQESKKTITFFNLEKCKNYTLNYDGTTKFMDKYGSPIVIGQLEEGEIVDIQFLKEEKLLSSLAASSDIWTMSDVSKYELDLASGKMKLLDEYYTLDESTMVFSDGKQADFLDIHEQDGIKIRGIDHKIYSISIEKGHGYLRLENEEYFLGGFIEVGQKIIRKIEEDMLLTVPEGTYEVYLSHSGVEGTKEVKIDRNQETVLDVGDLKKEDLIKYGNLIFTIEPSTAKVYLDGKVIDTSRTVKATYGLHQIMVKEEGYETVIQYIRVTENGANVAITLDEESEPSVSQNSIASTESKKPAADTSVSQNTTSQTTTPPKDATTGSTESDQTTSDSDTADSSTTGYKVTIESPAGAEVYVDGSYVGIIPVSFKNKTGTHEVIVRKSGYTSRSYTIQIEDADQNVSFSFSELTPIE